MHRKPVAQILWFGLLLCATAAITTRGATVDDTEPRSGEHRITVFPFYPLADKFTGFGYLGYVASPDMDCTTNYLGTGASVGNARMQHHGHRGLAHGPTFARTKVG